MDGAEWRDCNSTELMKIGLREERESAAKLAEAVADVFLYNETVEYYPCECDVESRTFGLLNAGVTYEVGGYYGWRYQSRYWYLYPFDDIHVSVGDTVKFKARGWTGDDLWLVNQEVYESCNFSDAGKANVRQLAISYEIRGDNEKYPQFPGGYKWLAQHWHKREFGMYSLDLLILLYLTSLHLTR